MCVCFRKGLNSVHTFFQFADNRDATGIALNFNWICSVSRLCWSEVGPLSFLGALSIFARFKKPLSCVALFSDSLISYLLILAACLPPPLSKI